MPRVLGLSWAATNAVLLALAVVLAALGALAGYRAWKRSRITPEERREIVDAYESGLRGYTYFEK